MNPPSEALDIGEDFALARISCGVERPSLYLYVGKQPYRQLPDEVDGFMKEIRPHRWCCRDEDSHLARDCVMIVDALNQGERTGGGKGEALDILLEFIGRYTEASG